MVTQLTLPPFSSIYLNILLAARPSDRRHTWRCKSLCTKHVNLILLTRCLAFIDHFRRTKCLLSTLTHCRSHPSTLAHIFFFQGRRTFVTVRHLCCWISSLRWLLRQPVYSELPTAQLRKASRTDETYVVSSFTKHKIWVITLKISQWAYMFSNEKCYWLKTMSNFF